MSELEKKLLGVLQAAVQHRASDVHFASGQAAALRAGNTLQPVALPPFTPEEIQAIATFMIADPKWKANVASIQDLEGAFEVKGLGRFRFSLYRTGGQLNAVLRVIPKETPTLDGLKLPAALRAVAALPKGLVLVTGARGSGRSTTLAALLDFVNEQRSAHILTLEDPVEHVLAPKRARISQRELGRDTAGLAAAFRGALRQDPDVLFVGELRDYESLDVALKAAETGHLVFASLSSPDVVKSVQRILALFPAVERENARARLSDALVALVAQRLVPGKAGGRVAIQQILLQDSAITECILNEKKTSELSAVIEELRGKTGMQNFDQHLADLVGAGLVAEDVALAHAGNPEMLRRELSMNGDDSGQKSSLTLDTPEEPAEGEAGSAAAALAASVGAPAAPEPGQMPRPVGGPAGMPPPAAHPPRPVLTPMPGGGAAKPNPHAGSANPPKIPKIPA